MRDHKVLRAFLIIIAITFIVHQIYSSTYKPITTVAAAYSTEVDGLDVTGMIIRSENYITSDRSGALHFVAVDGARVAKDGVIANIYSNATASVTVSRIEELQNQIADIEEIQGYNDVQAADLGISNSKVNNALDEFIRGNAAGNFSSSDESAHELLTAINRRQMITGEQLDFSAQLASLKSELESLQAALPQAQGYITASSSGYFVSGTDGYETVLTPNELESITPEFLDGMKTAQIPKNTIGKMVSDYDWYIAAKVSINDSLRYKVGDSLTITTSIKSSPELQVKVKHINVSENSDSAVIIFACQQMNRELASMRSGRMTIVNKMYSGLKIPKKSLRVSDTQTGVYVKSGISLKFVPVNVIYSTDTYIICEQQKSVDTVLRLYDEVVVKGRRLYDGKIVD